MPAGRNLGPVASHFDLPDSRVPIPSTHVPVVSADSRFACQASRACIRATVSSSNTSAAQLASARLPARIHSHHSLTLLYVRAFISLSSANGPPSAARISSTQVPDLSIKDMR
jgi:hypothetical protein